MLLCFNSSHRASHGRIRPSRFAIGQPKIQALGESFATTSCLISLEFVRGFRSGFLATRGVGDREVVVFQNTSQKPFHELYLRGVRRNDFAGSGCDIDGLRKAAAFRHFAGIEAALPLLLSALFPAGEKSALIGKTSQP